MRHDATFAVMVEKGTWCRLVGPFYARSKADAFASKHDGKNGLTAHVVPVHSTEDYERDPHLPVAIR